MNLRMHQRMNAHADKIEDLLIAVQDRLETMPQDSQILQPQELIIQLVSQSGIKSIELPEYSALEDGPLPVGTIKREVYHHHQSVIQDRFELNDEHNSALEEWTAETIWSLEKEARGETGETVTLGAGPFAKRVAAVLGAHLVSEGMTPRELDLPFEHLKVLDGLKESRSTKLASLFLSECTRTGNYEEDMGDSIGQTEDKWDHEWSVANPADDCIGRPSNYHINVGAGCLKSVVTIQHTPTDNIYIDDEGANLPIVLPESLLNDRIGKPFDTIYDHPLVRDLDMLIERYIIEEDGTKIWFKPWKARSITVTGMKGKEE